MKLFADNIIGKVDSFLHAGYVSAYPRTLAPDAYPPDTYYPEDVELLHQLDLVEALRLEDAAEALAAGSGATEGIAHASALGASGFPTTAMIVLGILVFLYHVRRYFADQAYGVAAFLTCAFALLVIVPHCATEELPTYEPWADAEIRAYASPADATIAILHGIIAPALANMDQEVTTLANIQNDVALPTKNPTPGLEYALENYGLDGWGNEFHFDLAVDDYAVTSAGPDGSFSTEDDIKANVAPFDKGNWDFQRMAFYLVKHDRELGVFFHKWTGRHFRYNNEEWVRDATGQTRMDAIIASDYPTETRELINETFDEVEAEVGHSPIVLQVFK